MMKTNIIGLISGVLFGLGLAMSAMINPVVVIGFLDIFGNWNPALMFVMIGGLIITIPTTYLILSRRQQSFFGHDFDLPISQIIDKKLIVGTSIFGIGWGLVGLCPGAAIASLALGLKEPLIFVGAMYIGFLIADRIKI
jgi:uncharacterized protein